MSENSKNYFFWNEAAFENAVKDQVCPRCEYVGRGDECHDPDPHGCALFRHLSDLVRIAQRMKDPGPQDYAGAVDETIKVDLASFGLDRLLPYVLETVTKTDQELEARNSEVLEGAGRT